MGRIQRKKTNGRPKPKAATKTPEASEPQNGNRAPAKAVSTASVSRQPAKAPANYPGRKYVDAAIQFLREVKVELKKVTWPSRKQTISSTIVVIVLVLIISIYLGLVDVVLQHLLNLAIK